jgi:hypothetical protein
MHLLKINGFGASLTVKILNILFYLVNFVIVYIVCYMLFLLTLNCVSLAVTEKQLH